MENERQEYLTENFKNTLTEGMSTSAAMQIISMLEFGVESFLATDREGWREGVIDGLCRQLTKLAVPDIIERYWKYRGPYNLVEEITSRANEEWGIRQSIKDVFFADEAAIDLNHLTVAMKDYWGDLFDWIVAAYTDELYPYSEECRLEENEN